MRLKGLAAGVAVIAAMTTAGMARPADDPVAAIAVDPAIMAPIRAIMDGFNKGDIAMVRAAHVADPTIIDNVPPYIWSGPGSFDTWLADLMKAEAEEGKSDGAVWFGTPVDEHVSGDHAWVVTRCSYIYRQGGKTVKEEGYTSFVLAKQSGQWKIQSWTWASPKGAPVVQ